jgi:hypothetical protein
MIVGSLILVMISDYNWTLNRNPFKILMMIDAMVMM